jgi:D-arabinose 1-dehydrogenase-like Zn-dependent alcohol dehydrogenase
VADPDNPFLHPSGEPFDVILHTTAKPEKWDHFHRVLAPRGVVVSTIPEIATFLRSVIQNVTFSGHKMVLFMVDCTVKKDLKLLVDLMASGELKTVVDSKTPLVEAKMAWEKCLGGHASGKRVVTVP